VAIDQESSHRSKITLFFFQKPRDNQPIKRKIMQITGTNQEINTVRAALRAQQHRIIEAMRDARHRMDDEHISFLKAEQANVRAALKALGYAYIPEVAQ
jgi:hypothetical protein